MPTVHWRNAYIAINGVDLSDDCSSLSVSYEAEMLDETAMGDTTRQNKGGLFNWGVEANFHQDFGASQVDATLFNLVGTTVCFEIRPNNSCSSANNPIFSATGVVQSYQPLGGEVGTLLDCPVSLVPGGTAGSLNRASSS